MSISKYFSAIGLVTSLLSGCEGLPPEGTDVQVQRLMAPPQVGNNSSQAFGGQIGSNQISGLIYSSVPPPGAPPSATNWWLMVPGGGQLAPIDSIAYNGGNIVSLSTTQGWLQVGVRVGRITYTYKVTGMSTLDFQMGGSLTGTTLRVQSSVDAASYGQYTAQWSNDGGVTANPFCPHVVFSADGTSSTVNEYMIPVGGAKWLTNGNRVDDSSAISLSCVNDSIGGCVTWGYAPWDSVGGVSLRDHHQACTRMKKADWCGTGDPDTTLNHGSYISTKIQVWDSLDIHSMYPQTRVTMEAFWDVNGATCVNVNEFRTYDLQLEQHLHDVWATCPKPSCSGTTITGLTGSARPCLTFDRQSGLCAAN